MNVRFRIGWIATVCLMVTACSSLETDRINYRSASKAPSLEVPPDLTQLTRETRYAIPGTPGAVSSSSIGNVAQRNAGELRVERRGDQQWLVSKQPPEQLWEPIKDFWKDAGFVLMLDQPTLGIMETDWAENRAKIPQDIIRRTIGRVLDGFYSSGERDKFRTRLERNADGGTDIFITHRGMQEVYVAGSKEQTGWQPRRSDPELQAEFNKRLMLRLAGAAEPAVATAAPLATSIPATSAPAASTVALTSRATTVNNQPAVELDDGFDRAWRRVGLSLDRTSFTVEDRDRNQSTYFVRYLDQPAAGSQNALTRLFRSESAPPLKLRVVLQPSPNGDKTHVLIRQNDGTPASTSVAQRIVNVLVDDLK